MAKYNRSVGGDTVQCYSYVCMTAAGSLNLQEDLLGAWLRYLDVIHNLQDRCVWNVDSSLHVQSVEWIKTDRVETKSRQVRPIGYEFRGSYRCDTRTRSGQAKSKRSVHPKHCNHGGLVKWYCRVVQQHYLAFNIGCRLAKFVDDFFDEITQKLVGPRCLPVTRAIAISSRPAEIQMYKESNGGVD